MVYIKTQAKALIYGQYIKFLSFSFNNYFIESLILRVSTIYLELRHYYYCYYYYEIIIIIIIIITIIIIYKRVATSIQ